MLDRASIISIKPTTYYVYTYAYPDGIVFYVGKGYKNRINAHEAEAESGCECKKCSTIRGIWASSYPLQKRIVFETLDEQEAFSYERRLIASYAPGHLTNIALVVRDTQIKLRTVRERLGFSQQGLARRTKSVSTGTVKNAESGRKVTFGTATQILEAINVLLQEAGEPVVTLDDLGLTLY